LGGLGRIAAHGRIADGDVRKELGPHQLGPVGPHAGAHRVHHLHQVVVGRLRLGQQGGFGLVGEAALDLQHQRAQALVIVLRTDERNALDQAADAVAHLDRVAAQHHLELQVGHLELFHRGLLGGQVQVHHRQPREHCGGQQEGHQDHDQVDERGDLQVRRRFVQAPPSHDFTTSRPWSPARR
jgi:hypothetical protein